MNNIEYKKYLQIFSSISRTGHLLTSTVDHSSDPEICKALNKLESLGDYSDCLFPKNVIVEIEQNLYEKPESKITYITRILRDFQNISPYLLIRGKKTYSNWEDGTEILQIGDTRYFEGHVKIHKLLESYCGWRKSESVSDKRSSLEDYVIYCFSSFRYFFNYLDALCLDFDMDIIKIQEENKLQVWIRDNEFLVGLGYRNIVENKKSESTLLDSEKSSPNTESENRNITEYYFDESKNPEYTVKSIIMACRYLYNMGIYLVDELNELPVNNTNIHKKLSEKYRLSYDSFRNDWKNYFEKSSKRTEKLMCENIKRAIKLIETEYPDAKGAIELAKSELREAELKI